MGQLTRQTLKIWKTIEQVHCHILLAMLKYGLLNKKRLNNVHTNSILYVSLYDM